ncbi:unnamed protein product, partial [Didymodactylos carnosus]
YRFKFPVWRLGSLNSLLNWLDEALWHDRGSLPADEIAQDYADGHQLVTVYTNLLGHVKRILVSMRCFFVSEKLKKPFVDPIDGIDIKIYDSFDKYHKIQFKPLASQVVGSRNDVTDMLID